MSTPNATNKKINLIDRARSVLRGEWQTSDELKKLYKDLEEWDQFAYATDVLLEKIKKDQDDGKPDVLEDHQKLAKFIYKDHSLPSSFKFDRALRELNKLDDLSQTGNCETLGLAGAIHKYKWLYDHHPKNLELSLYYYKRGYESWRLYLTKPFSERTALERDRSKKADPLNDFGYTAINYAYMLELLAIDKLETMGASMDISDFVKRQIEEATVIRIFILDQFIDSNTKELNRDDYDSWVLATVAEAHFGLRNYTAALSAINQYKRKEKEDVQKKDPSHDMDDKIVAWKIRTFTRQLFSIAYLQQMQTEWIKKVNKDQKIKSRVTSFANKIDDKKITDCLRALAQKKNEVQLDVEIKKEGKVGLALSGGGFRASLFHIGVLAALAERDKLKDIEVISCVSGGSILGAYYYLELKKALTKESEIDYIKIVQSIEENFLKGIQKNLRMRVISNLWCNMRMIFDKKNYSRTHRIGELYEKHLYNRIDAKEGPFLMEDLIINPIDNPDNFNIATDNFNRKHKVPQLILNATTVNTGHNWQFTATWMGEPPGNIQSDIDVKPRLRRMYYKEAPEKYKKFRLGYAVGASSCVPVLFTPMPLFDLYPNDPKKEKIELQLIDGGLHDNQGIAALLEQECKNMIISDASGQMPTTTGAAANEFSTFFRADTILQERLRELQFKDIKERANTSQLNSLITLHLKSELKQMPISWLQCTDPPRSIYNETWDEKPNELTGYGILTSTQRLLSEIRTDLDSFNDTEAWALMYSGYSQTHYAFDKEFKKQDNDKPEFEKRNNWKFLQIKDYVRYPDKALKIEKILTTARNVPFKLIDLSVGLKITIYTIGILASIAVLIAGYRNWDRILLLTINVSTLTYAFFVFLVGFISKVIASLLSYKTEVRKKLALVIALTAAFVVSNIYLAFFNDQYNKAGKLK